MSKVLVTESYLSATGNAIRSKAGTYSAYKPSQFASAILSIPTVQDLSIGSKTISENGTYLPSSDSLDYYSQVTVSVSGVVPSGSISISENGSYDVTDYASAVVDVAAPSVSGSISISENGTYNVASYAEAVVDVPGVVPSGSLSISQNGAYDVASYASAVVSVEGGGTQIVTDWFESTPVYSIATRVEWFQYDGSGTYAMQLSKGSSASYEGLHFPFKNIEPNAIYELVVTEHIHDDAVFTNNAAFVGISLSALSAGSYYMLSLPCSFPKDYDRHSISCSFYATSSEGYLILTMGGLSDTLYAPQAVTIDGLQLYKIGKYDASINKSVTFPDCILSFDFTQSINNQIHNGFSDYLPVLWSAEQTQSGIVFDSKGTFTLNDLAPISRYTFEFDFEGTPGSNSHSSAWRHVIGTESQYGLFYRGNTWQMYTKSGWVSPSFAQEASDYFSGHTITVVQGKSGNTGSKCYSLYRDGVFLGEYENSQYSQAITQIFIGDTRGNISTIQQMRLTGLRVYDGLHSYSSGTLDSISVVTIPSKTSYIEGEALDLTGVGINATYTDSTVVDVTSMCTFDPANGDTLADGGTQPVVVEYTDGGITCSTSFNVTVDDTWKLIEGTSISAEAYWGDGGIQKVYGPDVITIGSRAFSMDASLYMASFPVATTIESSAFHKCGRNVLSGFTVSMPEVVTINGYGAFEQADLHSIELPKAEYIGYATFRSCRFLSQVSLPLVSFVDAWGFADCSALQTLELPQLISTGTGAFQNCSVLSQVSCPIAEIFGDLAFASCSNLETVRFSALSKIGYAMFSNCIKLSGLYLLGSSVAGFDIDAQYVSQAFYNTPMYDLTLTGAYGSIYVPSSLETSYKTAQGWSDLAGRIVGV